MHARAQVPLWINAVHAAHTGLYLGQTQPWLPVEFLKPVLPCRIQMCTTRFFLSDNAHGCMARIAIKNSDWRQ